MEKLHRASFGKKRLRGRELPAELLKLCLNPPRFLVHCSLNNGKKKVAKRLHHRFTPLAISISRTISVINPRDSISWNRAHLFFSQCQFPTHLAGTHNGRSVAKKKYFQLPPTTVLTRRKIEYLCHKLRLALALRKLPEGFVEG